MRQHPLASMNIFVIIPVHNRREITLGCLGCLKRDSVLEWANVIVVDDGSTDDTSKAIRENFPEVVLLEGNGNLWWTGGILTGMKHAMQRQAAVIVWLNDDSHPRAGAMERLVKHTLQTGAISVGQSVASFDARYTGWTKTTWGLRHVQCPEGQVTPCDTFPGNFVALPRKVVEELGYPDGETYPHVFADADYGLRALRHGCDIHVLGDSLADAILSLNPRAGSWLLDERPTRKLLGSLLDRTSALHPRTFWAFKTRHWGLLGALVWVVTYLRLGVFLTIKSLIPRSWLLRLVGRRSVAWKVRCATAKEQ